MKFGDYLRQKREEKNWTQPEASAAAGIEQSYLSKLETGKSWPSEDVFARVASVYGIEVDDMVRRVASSERSRREASRATPRRRSGWCRRWTTRSDASPIRRR